MKYNYKVYQGEKVVMEGTTEGKLAQRTRHEQAEWLKIQMDKAGYNKLNDDTIRLYMKRAEN